MMCVVGGGGRQGKVVGGAFFLFQLFELYFGRHARQKPCGDESVFSSRTV